MANTDDLKFPTLFNGDWIEFVCTSLGEDRHSCRLSTSEQEFIFDHDFREFKLLEFLVINNGTDGISHRISQILPVYWLEHVIIPNLNGENMDEYSRDISYRKFLYNFCRSKEVDRRCFIWFKKNNFNTIRARRVSTISQDSDSYDLVIRGFY